MFTTRKRGIMSFSGKIKVSIALLLAVGSCAMAAKSTSGKVVDKLGEAKVQKAAKIGDWAEISVGNRIKEKDQIRTGIESHVAIALSDGSSITVQENSLVEFTTLEAENGIQTALTDVKTGKVKFDAQKQHSGGSFKFKTATATAAIRGTDGFFGITTGQSSLITLGSGNALFVSIDGVECEVKGGQSAFFRKSGKKCNVLDAKSSGNPHFVKTLESLLDDENKTDEQVLSESAAADSALQSDIEKAQEMLKCDFEPLEDTISTNTVTIKGTCNNGISLSLAGTTIENASSFEYTTGWASTSVGAKKFSATCTISLDVPCPKVKKKGKVSQVCKKEVSAECGMLTTYYRPLDQDSAAADSTAKDSTAIDSSLAKPFEVTTSSPVTVCEPGSVTIEGTFDQTDPNGTLFVKMDSYKSRNLVPLSANGEFSHTITINDILHNWNATEVTVEYQGKSGTFSKKVKLNVDKTCKQVNQLRPSITFISSDSVKCLASFSLIGANDDLVLLSREIDGGSAKENTYNKNTIYISSLSTGVHDYTIKVEDQAGNKSSLKKTLGCYPISMARIEFAGPKYEPLRPPPAPPNLKGTASMTIHKTMRFKIAGVPQQAPSQIMHIKVVQANTTLLDITNNQIDRLDYDVQVELERSAISVIKVFVEMKNGRKISDEKTYEVK